MRFSILTSACLLFSACGAVSDPSHTDNHLLVSSGGQSNNNAVVGGPGGSVGSGSANDPSAMEPIVVVTADEIKNPCLQYCSNYGSCISKRPLDCEALCNGVVQQLTDKQCIEPVYLALDCMKARICSDGLPDLVSTPKASVSTGADASASNAANNCRLEALAVNCSTR